MSALMADRRDWAEDSRQASLFDALAPPPERTQPDEQGRIVEFPKRREVPAELREAPAESVENEAMAAPEATVVTEIAPAVEGASAIEAELVVTPTEFDGESCTPRAAGSPLAGPTLDDVMSRVWEGLTMGLPAACPLCDGEMLRATAGPRRGSCTSCGTTID
jgi:hypothetical protein